MFGGELIRLRLKGRKQQEAAEKCIIRSFIIFSLHEISLE
jgi:hypothetical protein